MRKTFVYALLLLVLAGVALYFAFREQGEKVQVDEQAFNVPDTGAITRIFLADRSGNKVLLERQEDGRWVTNGGFPANRDRVQILLRTVNKMEVKHPVAVSFEDWVLKSLSAEGVKVELYRGEGDPKIFYVGGTTQDELGTYMMIEGAEKPYVVHIPGFNGYLTSRFWANERDFLSKEIIPAPPVGFQSVSVQYTDEPEHSFTLEQQAEDQWTVQRPDGSGRQTVPTAAARQYLGQFHNLQFVNYVSAFDEQETDSLRNSRPLMILNVKTKDGQEYHVSTYSKLADDRTKTVPESGLDPVNRYIMYEDRPNQVMLVQKYTFNRILATYGDFAGQGQPVANTQP